uniref:InaF motif containing 2 n=1 Tax=Strigamia maritima TaxID=126957 RepID=T1J955_STRMM
MVAMRKTGVNDVKFAGEDHKAKIYEPKQNKKLIRLLTVMGYIFSVSLVAIMLSLYYVFLWDPNLKSAAHRSTKAPLILATPASDANSLPINSPAPEISSNEVGAQPNQKIGDRNYKHGKNNIQIIASDTLAAANPNASSLWSGPSTSGGDS